MNEKTWNRIITGGGSDSDYHVSRVRPEHNDGAISMDKRMQRLCHHCNVNVYLAQFNGIICCPLCENTL